METFQIISVTNNLYELINLKNNSKYEISLNFFDIKEKLKQGDVIKFNKELLNHKWEGYCDNYNFGSMDSIYGRNISSEEDIDLMKLIIHGKVIKLKRLYG